MKVPVVFGVGVVCAALLNVSVVSAQPDSSAAGTPAAGATALAAEDFDSLAPILGGRVDETGIPPQVKGFTHTPPTGWSVQLAPGMPQGVTEWQGWSFTTMPFWTAAEDQGRGGFTRAANVFAVADPDEWDDKGSPSTKGKFDSTLVSKPFDVPAGLSKLYLGFGSHYQQSGTQRAAVTVSFDGGDGKPVLGYGPNATDANKGQHRVNEYLSLGVDVPAGATTMTVTWRLHDAKNDWFWAIDDVRVADRPIDAGVPPLPLPQGPNGVSKNKVLLIGLDGTRRDKMLAYDTPNIHKLIEGGMYAPSNLYAPPMANTSSAPGWPTITHGVWPDKGRGPRAKEFPDFLTRAKKINPALSTGLFSDWGSIGLGANPIIGTDVDVRIALPDGDYVKQDAQLAATASRYLSQQNPDAAFVYFGNPDIAAHTKGSVGPEYRQAIETADRQIGQLLTAVESRKTIKDENWLIMISTDHGHTDRGGHGNSSPEERMTFVIANGKGIPAGSNPTNRRIVDVVPTALTHLGIKIDPTWDLDGTSLTEPITEPFDTVTATLKPRQDETAVPPHIMGFTHETPQGWTIDNARMPETGTAEWRGWSLTTDEFWTRTGADQLRELNVRSRGVFAVADAQRWNAVGNPAGSGQRFDSTLVTPAYNVAGKATGVIGFTGLYRHGPSQQARVLVSFDGQPDQEVYTYTEDQIAKRQTLHVAVPSGARKMTVKFHFTGGGGDWYWAVDNVSVTALAGAVHVGALTATSVKAAGNQWTGGVTVRIVDQTARPVRGVVVTGEWLADLAILPGWCVTNTEGTCTITSIPVANSSAAQWFVVKTVMTAAPYRPSDNTAVSAHVPRP